MEAVRQGNERKAKEIKEELAVAGIKTLDFRIDYRGCKIALIDEILLNSLYAAPRQRYQRPEI